MFDPTILATEAGATIGQTTDASQGEKSPSGFTPLKGRLPQEVVAPAPDFQPASATAIESDYSEASISNPKAVMGTGNNSDVIAELTADLQKMAAEKGIPAKDIGLEDQPEAPPIKFGFKQKVKGFFNRIWNWTRKNVDDFVFRLEKKGILKSKNTLAESKKTPDPVRTPTATPTSA